MAKKPIEETGESATVELGEPASTEPASTEPVAPEGYVLLKQADYDEMLRNLKMAR